MKRKGGAMELTPYKGVIRIICGTKGACPVKLKNDVVASCIDCPDAVTYVLDLDGRAVHIHKAKETGKKREAAKAKRKK